MPAPPEVPAASASDWAQSPAQAAPWSSTRHPLRIASDLSPPLIAMVAVVGTAFLIVFYARILSRHLRCLYRRWWLWRCRRRLIRSADATAAVADLESPGLGGAVSFGSSSDFFFSPYGLDDAAIKALPISFFSRSKAKQLVSTNRDCAVCLLEFEDGDYLRTLPFCSHAFHADCIDVWLRSHATCPLCRAAVVRPADSSPFVPMRAARIRPSLDDIFLFPLHETAAAAPEEDVESEITPAVASPPPVRSEDRVGARDFLLKRSYSFGFERSLAAERMLLEASTASPWRYRHRSLWSKRWPSPFGGMGAGGGGSSSASRSARFFSFRSYRGAIAKSPFLRRRGLFQLSSESSVRLGGFGAGPSSRRSRSMTSPSVMFGRPAASAVFSSSRMRCGDPEALLSPERLGR